MTEPADSRPGTDAGPDAADPADPTAGSRFAHCSRSLPPSFARALPIPLENSLSIWIWKR